MKNTSIYSDPIFEKWESWKPNTSGRKCFKCSKKFQFKDDWYKAVFKTFAFSEPQDVIICCECANQIASQD